MERQIINIKHILFSLLYLNAYSLLGQTKITSENLVVSTVYNFDTICHHNEHDSGSVIFQLGFEGDLEVFHNDELIDDIEAKYSNNLEMVPFIFKFKRTSKDVIKIIYNNQEKISLLVNRSFGIVYINRLIKNRVDSPYWVVKFDNCFYPARR